MTANQGRLGASLLALALLAVGAAQAVRAARAEPPVRQPVAVPGPAQFAGHDVALVERPGPVPDRVFVDVRVGGRVLPGRVPIPLDPSAASDDYRARYAGRFEAFAPRDPAHTSWQLLEIRSEASDSARVAYRLIEIAPDGGVGLDERSVPADAARAHLMRRTLGTAPPPRVAIPAPVFILAAATLLLFAWWRPPPAGRATLSLVLGMSAAASVVAWPAMLHEGLARTLPAPLIAMAVTAAVALAAGPRLQRWTAAAGRGRALLAGMAAGVGLLAVFVAAQVNVAAFIAPVFRPPGGAFSPADWFVHDYLAPAAMLLGTGLPLAVAAGACYGLACRRRARGAIAT